MPTVWGNWSHTPWRCLGVYRCPEDIAPEIPSGGTGTTLLGGVWECTDVRMRLLQRFLPGELVPHSLEVSGSVQMSGQDCSRDSFWGNWSHTLWRCLGVCRHLNKIAPEIPSGGRGPTLSGGVWECTDVWMRLLWRFLLGELVPHSLEVSGSVQIYRRDCSGDSFQVKGSHTLWRCLGVYRCLDKIASEIPSGGRGPTLSEGVWECADIWTRLLWRFLPGEEVPHSLEVSGSVQTSRRDCSRDSIWGKGSHTLWRCLGVCSVTSQLALSCDVHGMLFGGEVVSGLQYRDEQDHGSRAQPDIAEGLFLLRMQNVCCLQARGKSKGPLIAPLGRTKGDCPSDFETVIHIWTGHCRTLQLVRIL